MSLPGYGSLEVSCKVGKPFVEVHIHELIGFISSLLQLMYQVTKLHKGLAEKVLFCTVLYFLRLCFGFLLCCCCGGGGGGCCTCMYGKQSMFF